MRPPKKEPLSESQIDVLDAFLMSRDSAMDLEMMDGFMTALVCAPQLIPPSKFFPYIWGDAEFDNAEQAEKIISLVMQHWNDIESILSSGERLDPILPEEAVDREQDENLMGQSWAEGFLIGISINKESWDEVMEKDDSLASWILPAIILAGQELPSELEQTEVGQLDRLDLIGALMLGVGKFYEHFRPQPSMPSEFAAPLTKKPKIGRNDPCPCGSGKKYKRCCGR